MRNVAVALGLMLAVAGCGVLEKLGVKGADVDLAQDFYKDCIQAAQDAVKAVEGVEAKAQAAKAVLNGCVDKYVPVVLERAQS